MSGKIQDIERVPILNSHDHSDDEDEDLIPKPASETTVQLVTKYQPNVSLHINLMVLTVFLQSVGFTVMMPSMFNYLQSIDESFGGYNGLVVACYSAGQFLSSPLFGFWSNHRPTREPVIVSIAISVIGNLLYCICYKFESRGLIAMAIARFIVGVGAGNVAVCRSFASESSDLGSKTQTMAKMSGAQGAGFVLGPLFGIALYFLDFNIDGFLVNRYTSPGYLSVVTALFNILILVLKFNPQKKKETSTSTPSSPNMNTHNTTTTGSINNYGNINISNGDGGNGEDGASSRSGKIQSNQISASQLLKKTLPSELKPIIISIYLFAVVISIFAVFETILPEMTKSDFGWLSVQNAIILGSTGLLSVVIFIIISLPFVKKIDDRRTALFGFFTLFLALIFLSTFSKVFHFEKKLPLWQFLIGSIFVSIGYPIASSLIYAIFSKVLNPKAQGTKMGWLTAGGSMARMVGPLWAQGIWNHGGGEALFLSTALLCLTGFFVLLIFYRSLIPHPDYTKQQQQQAKSSSQIYNNLNNQNNNSSSINNYSGHYNNTNNNVSSSQLPTTQTVGLASSTNSFNNLSNNNNGSNNNYTQ